MITMTRTEVEAEPTADGYLRRMGPKTKEKMGGDAKIRDMLDPLNPILSLENLQIATELSEDDDDFGRRYADKVFGGKSSLGHLMMLQSPGIVEAARKNKQKAYELLDAIDGYTIATESDKYEWGLTVAERARDLGLS